MRILNVPQLFNTTQRTISKCYNYTTSAVKQLYRPAQIFTFALWNMGGGVGRTFATNQFYFNWLGNKAVFTPFLDFFLTLFAQGRKRWALSVKANNSTHIAKQANRFTALTAKVAKTSSLNNIELPPKLFVSTKELLRILLYSGSDTATNVGLSAVNAFATFGASFGVFMLRNVYDTDAGWLEWLNPDGSYGTAVKVVLSLIGSVSSLTALLVTWQMCRGDDIGALQATLESLQQYTNAYMSLLEEMRLKMLDDEELPQDQAGLLSPQDQLLIRRKNVREDIQTNVDADNGVTQIPHEMHKLMRKFSIVFQARDSVSPAEIRRRLIQAIRIAKAPEEAQPILNV
ncbi:MAG: hypothetical protein KAS93_01265 [Gammaproteobacteria bacterium]|nr:hypothetical protein [Gammaproteobacteria bacterium]